jgi:EAL domain-containing protein (putative c-di-GMP-specific phosphodiesterase class I)
VISPAEFIPIAEENGLIGRLGMQVVDRSCTLLARLGALGHDISCSVNLSVRQFTEFNLAEDVPRRVAAHGLAPSALRLEVTESLVADAESAIVDTMHALHALGFDFLLDDFGTGHSSLHRLQHLPFQTLKVDRSFVAPLQHGDQVMVRTVVDLAKALRLEVVAEGVETPEQLLSLLELGVTHLQGYLLARPMSDEALVLGLETLKRQGGEASPQVAAWLAASPAGHRHVRGAHLAELATVV